MSLYRQDSLSLIVTKITSNEQTPLCALQLFEHSHPHPLLIVHMSSTAMTLILAHAFVVAMFTSAVAMVIEKCFCLFVLLRFYLNGAFQEN